jgi:hypothetical protein
MSAFKLKHLRPVPDPINDRITRMREELGAEPEDFIAGYVSEADEILRDAGKVATHYERSDLHLKIVKQRASLADLLAELGGAV